MADQNIIVTLSQASEMTGVSKDTLRRWDKSGKLKPTRTKGGHRRYKVGDIEGAINSKDSPNTKQLVSATEAAKIAAVSKDTLRRWDNEGKISSVRTKGGHRRFLLNDLKNVHETKLSSLPQPVIVREVTKPRRRIFRYLFAAIVVLLAMVGNARQVGQTDETVDPSPAVAGGSFDASTDIAEESIPQDLDLSDYLLASQVLIKNKIPAINGYYFVDLRGDSITDVDAHHLGGKSAQSFLRSDEDDFVDQLLTFQLAPRGTDIDDGSLYINPETAEQGQTLFGIALNGSERFKIDSEGDVNIASNLDVAGTITGNLVGTVSTGFTQGSVTFADSGGDLNEDNSNLYWDDTNNRLGIGTSAPGAKLQLDAATATDIGLILKTTDDDITNNLLETRNSSGGVLTYISPVGRVSLNGATFGSGGHQFELAVTGNILATRIYSNTFRDSTNSNTWVGLTGTSPNQTLTIGNTGVKFLTFTTKATEGEISLTGITTVTTPAAAEVALTAKAAASQTANIQEWQDSSGGVLSWLDESGNLRVGTSAPDNGLLNLTGAYTGKALAIFDETGGQDIFTASASGTTRFVIQNDGDVGIGIATPGNQLEINDDISADYVSRFFNDGNNADRYGLEVQGGADDGSGTTYYLTALDGNGDITGHIETSSGTFQLTDVSDARTKQDTVDTDLSGLDIVNSLRVVDFRRTSNTDTLHHGFVAQEVREVFPYATSTNQDGYYTLAKAQLIPVLTKAVQEQQAEIDNIVTTLEDVTSSAQIASSLAMTDISVSGESVLGDVTVTGDLQIGTVIIGGFENSIDTVGDLKLQPMALGNLDIMAGKVVIDTNGNVNITEGRIAGNSSFRDSVDVEIDVEQIRIDRDWDEAPTTINVTPSWNTNVWVTEKSDKGFAVNFSSSPSSSDSGEINWLAIW